LRDQIKLALEAYYKYRHGNSTEGLQTLYRQVQKTLNRARRKGKNRAGVMRRVCEP